MTDTYEVIIKDIVESLVEMKDYHEESGYHKVKCHDPRVLKIIKKHVFIQLRNIMKKNINSQNTMEDEQQKVEIILQKIYNESFAKI